MIKGRVITVILMLLFLSTCYSSSAHADQWAKLFGWEGDRDEKAYSIRQTSDGGYIVAGSRLYWIAWDEERDEDAWILKLDGSGQVVWQKTYSWQNDYATGRDDAHCIQQTSDGGYIVAGEKFSYNSTDALVFKLDGNGGLKWKKIYGGTGYDYADSVQQTSDGGYIVAGWTSSFGAGDSDAWVLKFDGYGRSIWKKTYGGTGSDHAGSIQQTSDGGYIVAGYSNSFGAGGNDAWVLKLNGNGNVVWQKTYGGAGSDLASSIQQTSDGGYIVAGLFNSFGAKGSWVLKLDGNGNVVWQKTYAGTGSHYAGSIQQTSDGGYIVAASTNSFGTGSNDAWVLKLDGSGNVMWQKIYDNANGLDDFSRSIQQTSDGGYIVAGTAFSYEDEFGDYYDVWVLKLDGNGDITDCPIVTTSTATDNNTSAIVTDTNVTGVNITASPLAGTLTVKNISVPKTEVCYYINPDLPNIKVPVSLNIKALAGGSSTKPMTVSNTGYVDLIIGTMTITGTNADLFSTLNDFCSGQTFAPSSSCTVDVKFSPTSFETKTAYLNISSNDPDTPLKSVKLSGKGVKVLVTSPNGGETLKSGTTHTITWQTSNTWLVTYVATTRIYYRYKVEPFPFWRLIAKLPGNPGSHPWSVPTVINQRWAKVKVVLWDEDGNVCEDVSDRLFKIIP